MGRDTVAKLKGYVPIEDIFNFVREKYDKYATMTLTDTKMGLIKDKDFIKESYGKSQYWHSYTGNINFKNGETYRNIFYSYNNVNSYENLEHYSEYGLEDMVKSETTFISLGCFGNSKEIIESITKHFGGWFDADDCDGEPYVFIGQNADLDIKPVIKVTMQDIYEKFGGTVVIVDNPYAPHRN